jgi:hypothetical protein
MPVIVIRRLSLFVGWCPKFLEQMRLQGFHFFMGHCGRGGDLFLLQFVEKSWNKEDEETCLQLMSL